MASAREGRRGVQSGALPSYRRLWLLRQLTAMLQVELLDTSLVLFILPTTGNGAAPPSFLPLWTALLHPSLPSDFLEDLR